MNREYVCNYLMLFLFLEVELHRKDLKMKPEGSTVSSFSTKFKPCAWLANVKVVRRKDTNRTNNPSHKETDTVF